MGGGSKKKDILNITREQILTLYKAGPDAVLSFIFHIRDLFNNLRAQIETQQELIDKQQRQLERQEKRIQQLEAFINKNFSHCRSRKMNDRDSVSRVWLGFEDTGARQRRLHQTRIEGRSLRRPRTYSVPDCRPNQKRSSVSNRLSYTGGSTRGRPRKRESRWTHRRERDRDAGPINAKDSRSACVQVDAAVVLMVSCVESH